MDVRRRVGVMGGTFDPIHHGHLVAAQEAASALDLNPVLFIPVWQPPHKSEEPTASPEDRACMVRLAVADNPLFEVSTLEIERSGRTQQEILALILDLDNFKGINDTLGYAVGDVVLKEIADKLTESVRLTDYVTRIGGDER